MEVVVFLGGHVKVLSLVVGLGMAQDLPGICRLLLHVSSLSPQSPANQTLTREKKAASRVSAVLSPN